MKNIFWFFFSIGFIRFYELLSIIFLSLFANKIASEKIFLCFQCDIDYIFIVHYGSFLLASVLLFIFYSFLKECKNKSEKAHLKDPQKTTIIGIYKNYLANNWFVIIGLWVLFFLSFTIFIKY